MHFGEYHGCEKQCPSGNKSYNEDHLHLCTPIVVDSSLPAGRKHTHTFFDVELPVSADHAKRSSATAWHVLCLAINLPAPTTPDLEAILNIVGEIWKTTCIGIAGSPSVSTAKPPCGTPFEKRIPTSNIHPGKKRTLGI